MISVKKIDDCTFEVTVQQATTTTHRVNLNDTYYNKLTEQAVSKEELIKESFIFLLERESNTMIYAQFELPVIQSYFSAYEKDIRKRLKKDN